MSSLLRISSLSAIRISFLFFPNLSLNDCFFPLHSLGLLGISELCYSPRTSQILWQGLSPRLGRKIRHIWLSRECPSERHGPALDVRSVGLAFLLDHGCFLIDHSRRPVSTASEDTLIRMDSSSPGTFEIPIVLNSAFPNHPFLQSQIFVLIGDSPQKIKRERVIRWPV